MKSVARIVAAAVIDVRGVVGSSGTAFSWSRLGIDPCTRTWGWPRAFSPGCEKFRRMDLISRSVLLAAEVAGVGASGVLGTTLRGETALVAAGAFGSLDSDFNFARGLIPGAEIEPAVFSYTLSSTSLGELAIRHGLNGPCYAFSTAEDSVTDGLVEARAIVEGQEAVAAVVILGDAVSKTTAQALAIKSRWLVAAFVIVCDPELPEWLSWDELGRPDFLAHLADRLWSRGGST